MSAIDIYRQTLYSRKSVTYWSNKYDAIQQVLFKKYIELDDTKWSSLKDKKQRAEKIERVISAKEKDLCYCENAIKIKLSELKSILNEYSDI